MKLPALKEDGLLLSHTKLRVQLTTTNLSSLKKLWLGKCSPTGREGSKWFHQVCKFSSAFNSHKLHWLQKSLFKKMGKHTLGTLGLISFFFFFSNCKARIMTRIDLDNSLIMFNYLPLLLKTGSSLQNLSTVVAFNFFTTAIIQKTLSESQVLTFFLTLWVF